MLSMRLGPGACARMTWCMSKGWRPTDRRGAEAALAGFLVAYGSTMWGAHAAVAAIFSAFGAALSLARTPPAWAQGCLAAVWAGLLHVLLFDVVGSAYPGLGVDELSPLGSGWLAASAVVLGSPGEST